MIKMTAVFLLIAIGAGISSCMPHVVHQGNVLKQKSVDQVHVGDTKFSVELLLGTPVINDVLHPNKSTYIEEYKNPKTGKLFTRGIVITYDDELRVTNIRKFGFDNSAENKN